jgi:hypothetical protein
MVTLIKEAVFPPGSCGEGVVEASFGACEVWLGGVGADRDSADEAVGQARQDVGGVDGRQERLELSDVSAIRVQVVQEWQRDVLEIRTSDLTAAAKP